MLDVARRPLLGASLALLTCGLLAVATHAESAGRLDVGTVGAPLVTTTTLATTTTEASDASTTTVPQAPVATTAPPRRPAAPTAEPAVTAPPATTSTTVDPRDVPEYRVAKGRVVDDTGALLAGVCFLSGFPGPDGGPNVLFRTGADGRYRLPVPFFMATVYACDQEHLELGYGSAMVKWGDLAPGEIGPDIVLSRLGGIRGRIVDQQGNPVAGVALGIGNATGNYDPFGFSTGADGRFSVAKVAPGSSYVWLHQRPWLGGQPQRARDVAVAPGRWTDVEIVLRPWIS